MLTREIPDALAPFQVVGRHLRLRNRPVKSPGVARIGHDSVSRQDERAVTRILPYGLPGKSHELVHIELVIRKQDMILEMHRVGRGVVRKPRQGIIDSLRGEGAPVV